MPASKNSKRSHRSDGGLAPAALCFVAAAAIMTAAIAYFYRAGATLYFGDAEAHLNIARRIVDSRTPGWAQVGTTWLPLPHLLMIPLVQNTWMWSTGLGGAIASGASMAIAVTFLFAAIRRVFANTMAAFTAAAVFLLNPNTLYLGSIPMTEPMFFASLFALLYFTVCFAETKRSWALWGAAAAAFAGALTRYEAWFLLPFAAVYIYIHARDRKWIAAVLFCIVAGAGPLLWLMHNRWYFGDPLYFFRGPYSALAIQGSATYPGKGNWLMAAHYLAAAGQAVAGLPALTIGVAGVLAALAQRVAWPLILLTLPPAFYLWSIHSAGTPIFVPALWPNTLYNTRYALSFLPVIALGAAALAQFARPVGALVVIAALAPFLIHPSRHPITFQESEVNSRARREWISKAAVFVKSASGRHQTFFTSFGDLTGIYRTLGIPLRDTLTGDNEVQWDAAVARPDLFLHTDWAVAMGGDDVQTVVDRARLHGPRYELERRITVKGAPAIEIYGRVYENPLH